MKVSLLVSLSGLLLITACAPHASTTPVPPGCVITVEHGTITATQECDLDGDGVGQ
jgi:hypothetical protein